MVIKMMLFDKVMMIMIVNLYDNGEVRKVKKKCYIHVIVIVMIEGKTMEIMMVT